MRHVTFPPQGLGLRGWLTLLAIGTALTTGATARAQSTAAGPGALKADLSWPRAITAGGFQFTVYQPQIETWRGVQLSGRFALALRSGTSSNETYGVAFFTAQTDVDKVNRLVTLSNVQVTKVRFPTRQDAEPTYLNLLRQQMPQAARTIPLDHLEAVFALSQEAQKALTVEVRNTPPNIIYCTEPSLLVLVEGAPVLTPLVGTYQRVVNTRAVLLTNAADQSTYLFAASNWYNANSFTGSWQVDPTPPTDIGPALQAALATGKVDPLQPQTPFPQPPDIYVSTTPAEIVQTSGTAMLAPVPGTTLSYVANSDSALFYNSTDTDYYVLVSGRWFSSPNIFGPWTYVAPGSLPAGFAKIPPTHPKANVLASVPGTPQAQEAVIAAAIPQTATLNRQAATLQVSYQGAPAFAPIGQTTLSYATNTQTPVVMVSPTSYYACQGGAWFTAPSSTGPWSLATSVPPAIYSIPVSSPIHYATYAYVYDSTADTVTSGYTPGYNGVYVTPEGLVVYGSGYTYPPVIVDDAWLPCPVTYGFGWGMAMSPYAGFAYGFAAGATYDCWCHPYWGSYGWDRAYGLGYSRVNLNGTSYYAHWGNAVRAQGYYGYNAYTGRAWTAQRTSSFNPYTEAYTGNRRAQVVNPYGGAGSVTRYPASYPTAAAPRASMYSDAAGNVYRANAAGGYERYGAGGGWQPAEASVNQWANRESYAQTQAYQRYNCYRGYGGGGWGGRRR